MKSILCGILLICATGSVLANPPTAPTGWPTLTFTNNVNPYYPNSHLEIGIDAGIGIVCVFKDQAVLTTAHTFSVNLNNISQYSQDDSECTQSDINVFLSSGSYGYIYYITAPATNNTSIYCQYLTGTSATAVEIESYIGTPPNLSLSCKTNSAD